jgi:hypothetical protein
MTARPPAVGPLGWPVHVPGSPPAAAAVPGDATRERVERQQRRLPLACSTAPLPVPRAWAERPAACLAFGDTYAEEIAFARNRQWPVSVIDGAHLQVLRDP